MENPISALVRPRTPSRSAATSTADIALLAGALIAVIFLTWLFLSASSHGRWAWPVRLMSIAVMLAVYWCITHLDLWVALLREI